MDNKLLPAPFDAHTTITRYFLSQLEKGIIPWHTHFTEMPTDSNGQPFRDINLWLLANQPYDRNLYFTKHDIQIMGLKLKDGAQAHVMLGTEDGYRFVYNLEQVELPSHLRLPPKKEVYNPRGRCKEIIDQSPRFPTIKQTGVVAYYSLDEDAVFMPMEEYALDDDAWYSSLWYGVVQSTGHSNRLNRESCIHRPYLASKVHDLEQLIAEMGCSLLCSLTGLEPRFLRQYHNDCKGWLCAFQLVSNPPSNCKQVGAAGG